MNISSILGLNARFSLYSYPYNTRKGKKIAGSKLLTKKVLLKVGIATPKVWAIFRKPQGVYCFNWATLPDSFAFKPTRGLGGEGIIVVKKKARDGNGWITTQRKRVTPDDLQLHALDILEGAYNFDGIPDVGFCEEYVPRHKAFRRFAYRGTPDIRIIVFNKIPIIAMLRLPTKESGGRANLHQGAIGVGIDIATGITTHAVHHKESIRFKPGTKRKLHGIKIPFWNQILELAVESGDISGLGYLGVDVIIHPEKGPMILELNSAPGLEIQLDNMTGLRRRLERVEGLKINSPEHGVKMGKALFASSLAARVKAEEEGYKTVEIFESVKIRNKRGKKVLVPAKIDTGAKSSSIDIKLAKELGLYDADNILWKRTFKSSLGKQRRPVIQITFWLKGKRIDTTAGVSDRKRLTKPFIVGSNDLTGFLVNPTPIHKNE